ncbi:hypothetical protein GGR54DRAFT_491359 [Hypoxylon sp. NC1633]|nr:hypothetical protein GGR54DRAFT_491359 [Hypoxylon sp. NC1633]
MFREEGCNSSKIRDIEAFIDETYQEFRGSASYARYRKPSFDENKDGGTRISSLVAPYFDMETEAFLDRRDKCEDGHMKMMQRLVEAYQHGGTSVEELHMACTLDQSYYTSLSDSNDRDRDQVVFRFHSRGQDAAPQRDKGLDTANDGTKEPYNVPIKRARARRKGKSMGKLAMVSQLWLWKIDEDIIITAFPERWHGGYEKDILGHILGNLYDSPPSSFDQMVGSILQSCVGFVDAPSNAGLDENLFNIFEESIARVANNETIRYQKFCKHQQVCAEVNQKIRKGEKMSSEEIKAFRSTEDKICDITEEVKHLEEIKDIRDELRMVGRVLEDQKTVLRKYQADKTDRLGPDVLLKLELRERKAKMLGAEAESVENSLRNLLDLKQKQGNLNEARDTKKLADEAEKRALADKTQSKLLSVFTFVTVIYTPLAFISALFAIPSSDYPGGNNGNGATWRWWQILAGSLVAEIFTSLLIFAYWWGIHKKDGIKSKRSGRSRLISDLPRAITWETDEGSTEKSAHVELVGVKVDE